MARLAIGLPIMTRIFAARHFADRGDAVIPLLPMNGDVLITKHSKFFCGKLVFLTFDFLKAEDVRRALFNKAFDNRHAQAHRIDVPCRNGKLLAGLGLGASHGAGFNWCGPKLARAHTGKSVRLSIYAGREWL